MGVGRLLRGKMRGPYFGRLSHEEARSRARSSGGLMPKQRGEEMGAGPGSVSTWGQEKKREGGGSGAAVDNAGGRQRPDHDAALSEQGSAEGL
jgi:hypothetical protein